MSGLRWDLQVSPSHQYKLADGMGELTIAEDVGLQLANWNIVTPNWRCHHSKAVPSSALHSCCYLYWIVSDVVDARSLVMRIRTMLNRKMKLI